MPIFETAFIQDTARFSAFGFALPMSSLASITMRLAKNAGSSPAASSLAR